MSDWIDLLQMSSLSSESKTQKFNSSKKDNISSYSAEPSRLTSSLVHGELNKISVSPYKG